MALSAVDLERHHDAVADPHRRDVVSDGHHLGETFMPDGVSGRHGQNTLGNADIQVAAGHRHGSDKGLPSIRDHGIGDVPPRVASGLLEHQLLHRAALL